MKYVFLAAAVASFIAPVPTLAATITYVGGPSSTNPLSPAPPKFDPGLGTLDSVDVQFAGTQIVRVQTEFAGQTLGYTARGFYSVFIAPLFFDFTGGSTAAGSVTFDANGFADFTLSGGVSSTISQAAQLPLFQGAGTLFLSPATDPIRLILSNGFDGFPPNQTQLSRLTGYSISYNYTPTVAAVPEAATWMMMLAGFGVAGAGLRRRRGGISRLT